MSKPLVIVTRPLPDDWIKSLEGRIEMIIGDADLGFDSQNIRLALPIAEGIICLLSDQINKSILDRASRLMVVSNMAAGFDNIDINECTARKIPVGNTPGILTNATADLTLGLILSLTRKLNNAAADARDGLWKTWSPTGWLGIELDGKTIGIVGMGKIGLAVARRAAAFGMKVIYCSRSKIDVGRDFTQVEFDQLIHASDIVSLHCPLTPETTGLINATNLGRMKKSAILINTSRGKVVDQAALVEALRNKTIFGAALDVTEPEPLPSEHPLFQLENCLILPHIGSATEETRKKMAEMACANLLAGLFGRPLPNIVNPKVYG